MKIENTKKHFSENFIQCIENNITYFIINLTTLKGKYIPYNINEYHIENIDQL
jgi:hypothetical protein